MFDLNEVPDIPFFEVKTTTGIVTFDVLELIFQLRHLENIEDPKVIKEQVNTAFGLQLSSIQACALLAEVFKFAKENAEEATQKVFGQGLFSTTTTGSAQENTSN